MSAVKDGCRKAFQAQPQRLMAAMYSCDISVDQKVLGKSFTIGLYPLCDVELYLIFGDLYPFQNQKKVCLMFAYRFARHMCVEAQSVKFKRVFVSSLPGMSKTQTYCPFYSIASLNYIDWAS